MRRRYIELVSENIYEEHKQLQREITGKAMAINLHGNLERECKLAIIRSIQLEPDLGLTRKDIKKHQKATLDALAHLNKQQYSQWDEEDIIQAHYLITQGDLGKGYRQGRSFITDSHVSVPSHEKVAYHMSNYARLFSEDLNTLEKSILAHFHGVRIHPFEDGNGRTFRLIQNAMLHQRCTPPFIIELAQRSFYNNLLEDARDEALDVYDSFQKYHNEEYRYHTLYMTPTHAARRFADFVASQINIRGNKILGNNKRYPR